MTGLLAQLGQQAATYAKSYVQLVEALMREGVPEKTAREEARATAAIAVLYQPPESGGSDHSCPMCGR